MKSLFTTVMLFGTLVTYAQTNSYPSSGNVKIFAVDAAWAEGISIVKPAGWSGIRLTRNDPAAGNFSGNWALGYNASTGNDFSISTNYNGTQYDGLLHLSNSTRNVGIGTSQPSAKLDVAGGILGNYGKTVILGTGTRPYFLVGVLPTSSGGVFHKLKIEVFGGNWHNSNLGEVTFYISSRDGLQINQEIHGGSIGRFALKVFQVNDQYEVAIQVTDDFPSFTIRSWKIDGGVGLRELSIADYLPGGQEVTPAINTIYASSNDGNVGIGTTTPDAKLAVKGQIHAQEVKVDLNGSVAPDYVFSGNYQLPTLDCIKTYIDQNKHLPEVPSAKEMEANGINLGEMNMILLKKIEELTLYQIEANKKIELLQSEILKLKKD